MFIGYHATFSLCNIPGSWDNHYFLKKFCHRISAFHFYTLKQFISNSPNLACSFLLRFHSKVASENVSSTLTTYICVFSPIPVTAARNKFTGLGRSTASAVLLVLYWYRLQGEVI